VYISCIQEPQILSLPRALWILSAALTVPFQEEERALATHNINALPPFKKEKVEAQEDAKYYIEGLYI